MGSHSGGGYNSSPSSFEVLTSNIERWSKTWPLDPEGRFGKKRSEKVSEIETDDPHGTALAFLRELGRGGQSEQRRGKYGLVQMRVFDDGSRIVHRRETRSSARTGEDHPAVGVEIRTFGTKYPAGYRIHFNRKGTAA